jgi:dolichol kinase
VFLTSLPAYFAQFPSAAENAALNQIVKQCQGNDFYKKDSTTIIKYTMEARGKFLSTSSPLKRGLFHIFGGLFIPVAALFLPKTALIILLCVMTFIFLAFELTRLRSPVINRWFFSFFKPLLRDKEASRLTGASYILIASLIAFLAFQRDIAVLALSFLAVGDPLATIVGKQIGKRKLLGKTLEGDLACFISCVAVGVVFYYLGLRVPLLSILAGAIGATIVEAIPLPINDNLTMPLFVGVVMTIMQL